MAQEPRSGAVEVGGIGWLGRMIDKARLEAAGEIAQFDLDFPCPMDRNLLSQLGLDSKTFQKIAVEQSSDDAILSEMKAAGAKV